MCSYQAVRKAQALALPILSEDETLWMVHIHNWLIKGNTKGIILPTVQNPSGHSKLELWSVARTGCQASGGVPIPGGL